MTSLAEQVGAALKLHGMMLATAESCTGGGIAEAVTAISGSSSWFERGFVTYANAAKVEMLGVRQSTLDAHGAVSEATVREMAAGALQHSHAHIAVAVSGVAGPAGGTPEKPVGTVWFGWALRDGEVHARLHNLKGDRAAIREQSVEIALRGVLNILNNHVKTA
ncbi:nicotinamide-nucleotide amidohydrolase PncC [Sideroxyarcus emersonii]|uniref:Nicotinamide-nucleotide amidohydrolase PncC n=1 Tax=Sideroxyarcus emersonii TaxID=2764705 RepID=A0AAN2BZD8_9PROT|nr:CinA family protein [Sideroxyarcus emersonii]BCK88060.1 nicotinamide-nucleotide amidohydrolase PncC [Sideroxyarcus emersonii]